MITNNNSHHDSYSKNEKTNKRVCLFGLSADPPTGQGGHLGIVAHLASMEMFDQVHVLPVYSHMFSVSCCLSVLLIATFGELHVRACVFHLITQWIL